MLLVEFDHHVRNLDILFCDVFSCNFEDDVLLMFRYGFLADGLDELGHPRSIKVSMHSAQGTYQRTYLKGRRSLFLLAA